MAEKERWVRVCPKCGSEDVTTDDKAGMWKFSGGTLSMYNCRKCGFRGALFPEDKKPVKGKARNG